MDVKAYQTLRKRWIKLIAAVRLGGREQDAEFIAELEGYGVDREERAAWIREEEAIAKHRREFLRQEPDFMRGLRAYLKGPDSYARTVALLQILHREVRPHARDPVYIERGEAFWFKRLAAEAAEILQNPNEGGRAQ